MLFLFAEAEESAHHAPIIVRLVNQYFGEYAYKFEMDYTYPVWKRFLAKFGTTPEAAFGPYSPENAIPWYTIMFVIACILSVLLIWVLKGKLSEDEPGGGQQTLEAGVLAVRGMLEDIVGPHGLQYFPVVMTFAVLILISNIMGFFPLFMTPTAAVSVTFALGLSSFIYYNYIGLKENGLIKHLGHLAGPIWWIAPLIFPIELISNFIRPFSLGIRLFRKHVRGRAGDGDDLASGSGHNLLDRAGFDHATQLVRLLYPDFCLCLVIAIVSKRSVARAA